jgi:hypothetical protein
MEQVTTLTSRPVQTRGHRNACPRRHAAVVVTATLLNIRLLLGRVPRLAYIKQEHAN